MTYTFKLARRLAVSRNFSMLSVLLVLAACNGGDATAPSGSPTELPVSGVLGWRPRESTPVTVRINPSSVTLETNQLIRFQARGRNRAGDDIVTPVSWSTSGGTILPDGRFSAAMAGEYRVIGRTRTHDDVLILDTSLVKVVRRQNGLASIEVSPDTATLFPRVSRRFAAVGILPNGNPVAIGVSWTTSGGSIDAGGTYTAGDTAGTYQVVATNTAGTLADTATITIAAPPVLPPPSDSGNPAPPTIPTTPPPPDTTPAPTDTTPPVEPPPPPPVLAKVILTPATAALASRATRQFAAYGRNSVGDSVPVSVKFAATGGTVTTGGLFTAGVIAGSYRVVASVGGLADTSTVTVTVPLGSGDALGIPLGAFHLPPDSIGLPSLSYTGAYMNGIVATLKRDLDKVQARKGRVVLGVLRSKTKDSVGRLSVAATRDELNRWKAAVDLNPYLADGTIVGIYLTDDIVAAELWGGEVPPLPRIDSLGLAVKTLWPSAVTMIRARPTALTGYTWRWIETAWAQYNGPYRDGTPENYRDVQVAAAKALKLGLVLWINVLDGGCGPTTFCVPGVPGTAIEGTFTNSTSIHRFQVSAAEVLHYGKVFLAEPYNCAAIGWQWSPIYTRLSLPAAQLAGIRAFDTRADVRAAFATLSTLATQRSRTSCRQR
jgi:hypothetical protein